MLSTIEINGSFYRLQRPHSYQLWYRKTPANFVFSVKGPRYITHILRLKNAKAALGNFFASGVLHLQEKLGPFLWQLPPNFLFYEDLIGAFLKSLPRTVGEAIRLMNHADREEPDYPLNLDPGRSLRHALEVRHHSFENPDFIQCLREQKVALVFADTSGKWPYMEDVTTDFVYLRLHGEKKLYSSRYSDRSIAWWAKRLTCWGSGREPDWNLTISEVPAERMNSRDAYVYFDNDIKVDAPFDAIRLRQELGR